MRLSVKGILSISALFITTLSLAQIPVDLSKHNKNSAARASVENGLLNVTWPTGNNGEGRLSIDLNRERPLIASMQLRQRGASGEGDDIHTGAHNLFHGDRAEVHDTPQNLPLLR